MTDAQCASCRNTNIQYNLLIKAAQQHVTTLVSPLHLFQAVQQLMSILNVAFATMGAVTNPLPDAGASRLCWLQAYGVKQHIKFTTE